jgi:hypothetical protein
MTLADIPPARGGDIFHCLFSRYWTGIFYGVFLNAVLFKILGQPVFVKYIANYVVFEITKISSDFSLFKTGKMHLRSIFKYF